MMCKDHYIEVDEFFNMTEECNHMERSTAV
jgi:hypothetical protein